MTPRKRCVIMKAESDAMSLPGGATRSILNYAVKSTEITPYCFLKNVVSLDFAAHRHLNHSGMAFA
jgi:hypothetical protein